MEKQQSRNPFLLIIIFILVGLILGISVGGFAAWKNKKAKEKSEQPLQAQKTQEQKSKEQENKKTKEQEIKLVEVKDWQTYENKTYKYKIKYPKSWYIFGEKEETPWSINFTSYETKDIDEENIPGVKVEILVQGNPKNLNIQDWVEEGHQISGAPKLAREMKISDLDATWEELDFLGPTINVTIMRANDVFTIFYTGRTSEYKSYKKAFEEMTESLEIEK